MWIIHGKFIGIIRPRKRTHVSSLYDEGVEQHLISMSRADSASFRPHLDFSLYVHSIFIFIFILSYSGWRRTDGLSFDKNKLTISYMKKIQTKKTTDEFLANSAAIKRKLRAIHSSSF